MSLSLSLQYTVVNYATTTMGTESYLKTTHER